MNTIFRRLMSGASFAALSLGVPSVARAATTILSGVIPDSVYTAVQSNSVLVDAGTVIEDFVDTPPLIFIPDRSHATYNTGFGVHAHATNTYATRTGAGNEAFNHPHGIIAVGAYASGSLGAEATAIDLYETAHRNGNGIALNSAVNGNGNGQRGVMVAFATAAAAEFQTAHAIGIDQFAGAPNGDAVNQVTNNGTIGAYAFAGHGYVTTTTGLSVHHHAPVSVGAFATGVFQDAGNGVSESNTVLNRKGGDILAHAFVSGHTASEPEFARAEAIGVFQDPVVSQVAFNNVTNNGFIGALADGHNIVSAEITAIGVEQSAIGHSHAENYVSNLRLGTIAAYAFASDGEFADVLAIGVDQIVAAHSTTGKNFVTNDGLIVAFAAAREQESGANVTAIGVKQEGEGRYPVSTVFNHGTIVAKATLELVGGDQGTTSDLLGAHAIGVSQAGGNHSGTHLVTNAQGYIGADAYAFDDEVANAFAVGVRQSAGATAHASNKVINYGTIVAFASAADADVAYASAVGVQQYASGLHAINSVNNSSGLIGARANAEGGLAEFATASAVGVSQVDGGSFHHNQAHFASNLVANNAEIFALATASNAEFVNARASGVHQQAQAVGVAGSAFNSVSNVGFIGANAFANDALEAAASAAGVSQHATASRGAAVNAVSNLHGGVIFALASASDASENNAHAIGVIQNATGSIALNIVGGSQPNGGLIAAVANADAFRTTIDDGGDFASARATAVKQVASAADAFSVSSFALGNVVSNTGTMIALAHVTGANEAIDAYAEGVNQSVQASSAGENLVFNGGLIAANAVANGLGVTDAFARGVGVSQRAVASSFALNSVTNAEGAIIVGLAGASGAEFGTAEAAGVDQFADGAQDVNTVVNSGLIIGGALAFEDVVAKATAAGVSQSITDAGLATNAVVNHGLIVGAAGAFGLERATVAAFGVEQKITEATTALNSVMNDGAIVAFGFAEADSARASAAGVHQRISEVGTGTDVVHNTGPDGFIGGFAIAEGGNGDGSGGALAFGTGVTQHISEATVGHNSVFNSGVIIGSAVAGVTGLHTAKAFGVGVTQQIANSTAGVGTNLVHNTGAIVGIAHASGYHATADATGVSQGITNIGLAKNTVVNNVGPNDGTQGTGIFATAKAFASVFTISDTTLHAAGVAHATAAGVDQRIANVSTSAFNLVTNDGVIAAHATASANKTAVAVATGVNQSISHVGSFAVVPTTGGSFTLTGGVAHNTVHNNAMILASANAGGRTGTTTDADLLANKATATAVGVHQGIAGFFAFTTFGFDPVLDAHNSVVNNGTIVAYANAAAKNSANANATGVNQQIVFAVTGNNVVSNSASAQIKAVAHATEQSATTVSPAANAFAGGVLQEQFFVGSADNAVVNHGFITATAIANATEGLAEATAIGVGQQVFGAFTAYNTVTNAVDGHINVLASAEGNSAQASAVGIEQGAGFAFFGRNIANNSGDISIKAKAVDAPGSATATAFGIGQNIAFAFEASNSASNLGHITVHATATGTNALALAGGIAQHASDVEGIAQIAYNDGLIKAIATANATAEVDGGHANAYAAGILQEVSGAGFELLQQTTTTTGVGSTAVTHTHVNLLPANYADNEGQITATANANGQVTATAVAGGIAQYAEMDEYGTNFASNGASATINVNAKAVATVGASGDSDPHATAFADAEGIAQYGEGEEFANVAINSGLITVHATASAGNAFETEEGTQFAPGVANAYANAIGIHQAFEAGEAYADVSNHGTISVYANAHAFSATNVEADAFAAGILVGRAPHEPEVLDFSMGVESQLGLDIINDGTIYAKAYAHADHAEGNISINATAVGIAVVDLNTDAEAQVNNDSESSPAIWNMLGGKITAEAVAGAESDTGYAQAYGIYVKAHHFDGTIENDGSIDAQAFGGTGETGGTARATGIRVAGVEGDNDASTANAGLYHGLVVNDGGFIFASDNHGTVHGLIGDAINVDGSAASVSGAMNEVDIDLKGGTDVTGHGANPIGRIFGNIVDAQDPVTEDGHHGWTNTITVSNGVTYFDGSINPDDDANNDTDTPLTWDGTLAIDEGGTLWMANIASSYWTFANRSANSSNPVINVATYNQTGTLKLDIDGGQNDTASINAVTATLGGALVLNPVAWNYNTNNWSLFGNTQTYRIVTTTTGGLSGSWSTLSSSTGSPLLTFAQSETTGVNGHADLTVNRVAFNAVAGLTHNEKGVGTGLENAYDTSLTGEGALLYASLFQLNAADYASTLDALSDEEAGELAQADTGSAKSFVNSVNARLDALSLVPSSAQQYGNWSLWGTAQGNWTHLDSTASGPGYNASNGSFSVGLDTNVDRQFIIGVAGSVISKTSFTFSNGNRGSYNGYEIGGYARYNDDGGFYLQGNVSYGSYDNSDRRTVTLPLYGSTPTPMPEGTSPGASTLTPFSTPTAATGVLHDSFTNDVWSFYAEGGLPVISDPDFTLTPYLAVGYNGGSSGGFNETGSINGHTGPALTVGDAQSDSFVGYAGVQLGSVWQVTPTQVILPSLRVAWAHEFDSNQWKVNAYFDGLGQASRFTVDGSALSQDSALVDASFSAALAGNLQATIGYEGNINSDMTTQTVFGRLDIRF